MNKYSWLCTHGVFPFGNYKTLSNKARAVCSVQEVCVPRLYIAEKRRHLSHSQYPSWWYPTFCRLFFCWTQSRFFQKTDRSFFRAETVSSSSASHRQGLDYFCYMCCLTFIYTIAHVTIFCSHISFSEILCYFLPLIWHLTTWNALIICKSLFIKILNKNRFKTDPPVTQPLIFPYYNIWSLGIFFTFFKEFSIYVKEIHLLQSK